MDEHIYQEKMRDLMNDDNIYKNVKRLHSYKKRNTNIQDRYQKLLKIKTDLGETYWTPSIKPHDLPINHKPIKPMRPIVSGIGSTQYILGGKWSKT